MIKIIRIIYLGNYTFQLYFSDGRIASFDLAHFLSQKKGPLLKPLENEEYAKKCFIDGGALCWPNGLELSPFRLHEISKEIKVA